MGREVQGVPDPGKNVLPRWASLLVVVAHPDDESFGLGAILHAFSSAGAGVELLCFTRGEASTLHGVPGDLAVVRKAELEAAAAALGVNRTTLRDYADGALGAVNADTLAAEVVSAIQAQRPDGLLVFDDSGVTGHPDHVAATAAALAAAEAMDLPLLGWTLPGGVALELNREFGAAFTGYPAGEIDLMIPVDRERQYAAIQAHASQAVPGSVLWRRLELLGDAECLRWLRRPD
ncbi:MAG: PIG-L family deacetylase [Ramlibacter sp.]|nr:PIG-L family deacetylase [Cryobacterium sp.]